VAADSAFTAAWCNLGEVRLKAGQPDAELDAFRLAAAKLPIATTFVIRQVGS
jgi:ribosomal protein L16/L10AE